MLIMIPGESVDSIRKVFLNPSLVQSSSSRENEDRLRELLARTSNERNSVLVELASTRENQTLLSQALKDAIDNAEHKTGQMQYFQLQLQLAQDTLHRTCLEAAVRDALAQDEIRKLREVSEMQKTVIEELQDESEGLKIVIEDLEEENKDQQSQIGVLYVQAKGAAKMKRDIEALQTTIQIKKEYDTQGVQDTLIAGRLSVDARSGQRRAARRDSKRAPVTIDTPCPPASPTPTRNSRSSTATSNSDNHTNTHDSESESEDVPPPPVSSSAVRTVRRGKDIVYTGFSYPKEHVVPDCIPERNGSHHFLGIGSNSHYTRFSCKHCHFWCKEPKVKKGTGLSILMYRSIEVLTSLCLTSLLNNRNRFCSIGHVVS